MLVGTVGMDHSRRQPDQVAAAHRIFLRAIHTCGPQQAASLAAVDQQVVVVLLPAHLVVQRAAVMAQRGGIEVAAQRVIGELLAQRRRHQQAQAVGRQRPVRGIRHTGSRLSNLIQQEHNLVDLCQNGPVIALLSVESPIPCLFMHQQ
ncbi:hypothetical protein D3C81_1799860 [compost metagenome]